MVYFLLVIFCFSYKYYCNFVRSDACDISSIQASSYQKMGLRGNNFCCLGFSCNGINCNYDAFISIRQRMVTPSVFMAIIFLIMSFCYLFLLRLDYCQNLLWARPQHHGAARRKLTVTLLIMKIVSVLLWLPFTVATFVYHTTDSIRSLSDTKIMRLNMYLLLLFYTNSFVNPVVYTITMPEYRKALLLLFTRRQRQNTAVIPLHAR